MGQWKLPEARGQEREALARSDSRRPNGAAADEVDNLELVAVGNRRGLPGGSGNDSAVVFDGDAIRLEGESRYQILESGASGELGEGPRVAVDDEVHEHRVQEQPGRLSEKPSRNGSGCRTEI